MARLETVNRVLRLKDHAKEDLEAEVRKVRKLMRQEQELLDSLQKSFSDTVKLYEQKHGGQHVRAGELRLFTDYFSRLHHQMDAQKKQIMKRLAELNEVQHALMEAYKEKKLLEILQGRIVREEATRKEKSAQKEMDFMHLSRRHRH